MSFLLLLMELGAQSVGQVPMPVPPSNFAEAPPYVAAQTVAAPPAVPGPLPDPTNPTGPFPGLMKPKATGPAPTSRTAVFAIRGRVLAPGKEPSAMLEIDGKLALVMAGSVLAYGSSTVRVLEITSQEVRLEIASSGEKLSLR
jgi:hypothetical protein